MLSSQSWQSIHSEPGRIEVPRVEGGLGRVEAVDVRHPALHAGVGRVLQRGATAGTSRGPTPPTGRSLPHEEELLAGHRQTGSRGAAAGSRTCASRRPASSTGATPSCARPRRARAAATEVLQSRRTSAGTSAPCGGTCGGSGRAPVYSSVSFIQPMSHFMSKPRPPMRVGPRDHRPGRGLLGDHRGRRGCVSRSRRSSAAGARSPRGSRCRRRRWRSTPRLSRVVQVQHRGHGVHPQAVGVVASRARTPRWREGSCGPRCARS